ncbi:MAG: LysR family transcriptional regulator [Porphyrobacter sp.]|nr:LysR family transcriptional regulator [Porphyrobacter sp.]
MLDIDPAQLRRLDINLLLVFDEIYATGKFTAAAKRLGLTQSAISHAVKRLREIFGDELFVRLPHGVQPTPRAHELRPKLANALALIRDAVSPPRFDPLSDARVFRIGATDNQIALFAGALTARGGGRIGFEFRPIIRQQALEALQLGEIDLTLGFLWKRHPQCEIVDLYGETYAVLARAGHPAFGPDGITIEDYVAYEHVLIAPGGGMHGVVDQSLQAQGRVRRVALSVPNPLPAFAALRDSDHLLTLPRRLADQFAPVFGLVIAEPPLAIRPFTVRMGWSRRNDTDPANAWLRDQIRQCVHPE